MIRPQFSPVLVLWLMAITMTSMSSAQDTTTQVSKLRRRRSPEQAARRFDEQLGNTHIESLDEQRPTSDEYYRLHQRMAEQEARLRQLEAIRLPPVDSGVGVANASLHSSLESRLTSLEKMVGDTQAMGAIVPANNKPTQKWSGRVHFDYWGIPNADALPNFLETGDAATAPPDFIGFRRLRFGVAGDVTDTMRYKIEMEWAAPVVTAFKDAYLGWDELPFLQTVLLGNQKRPYGLCTLDSSRYNVFMERPLHVEAFNQDARRFGLQSYGVSDDQRWNWRYGYFVMDDLSRIGFQRSDNYQSEVAGRLANTIWYDETSDGRGYAHWALSGSAAFPGGGPDARFVTRPESRTLRGWYDTGVIAGGKRYQLFGVEAVVNVGALQIVGEYQAADVQRTVGANLNFGGGYIFLAYFLTGEHTPWDRKSGTIGRVKPFENFFLVEQCDGSHGGGMGAWQVAARYSHGDFTDGDIFGGVGDTFTLGLNWWWTPYSRMQFNYIYGSMDQRAAVGGAPLVGGVTSGDYQMFGARFMVDF
jgi:phosphate-selective porin OprO/OprP